MRLFVQDQFDWGVQRSIRFVIFALVRLFYPRIEVRGWEHLPSEGPVIFLLNHPNGLIDPVILRLGLQRPAAFLAKSTLFGNPLGRIFMEAFGAIPVYRQQDEGLPGGAEASQMRQLNEKTFARCRKVLHQGGAVALFPEGRTHSGSRLLQLRTGAARIALGAEREAGWQLGLRIVPVGLWYQNKTDFRSSVLLVIGPAFTLESYAAGYHQQEQQAVKSVTRRIEESLNRVVLQAENQELLAALPVLASWVAPSGQGLALPEQHAWTARLLAAYEHLQQTQPARLAQLAQTAYGYAQTLQRLGLKNPWAAELPQASGRPLAGLGLRLALFWPLALAGFLMSYLPYRLARPLAHTLVGSDETQTGTFKLIGGSLLILLGWLGEALFCGIWFGSGWGLFLLALAPFLGYIALRWGEDWAELRELLAWTWLGFRCRDQFQALLAQRRTLAQAVMEAVELRGSQTPSEG